MGLVDRERLARRWTQGAGYHVLLLMLLGIFLLRALDPWLAWSGTLIHLAYLVVFIEALLAAATTRRQVQLGAALFFLPAVLRVAFGEESLLDLFEGGAVVGGINSLLSSLFLFYLVGLTLARLFRLREASWSAVSAAASGFLLLGVAWASIYRYLESVAPGSFRGLQGDTEGELFYFSFVTLTTLGFGDISPTTGPAQMLTSLEAILGQLYLVILVARLVGMVPLRGRDAG